MSPALWYLMTIEMMLHMRRKDAATATARCVSENMKYASRISSIQYSSLPVIGSWNKSKTRCFPAPIQ